MKEYVISITDDTKASQLLTLLNDLSYVRIINKTESQSNKRFSLMDNPLPVENFKRYNREELHERLTKNGIKHDTIASIISEITSFCDVASVKLETVNSAIALKKRYGFNYWDSLILSAALENGCQSILSEDMQNGQIVESTLKIVDIFKDIGI